MLISKTSHILAIISAQNVVYKLEKLLQDTGFELKVALTAAEGVHKAEEILPDVI